jgi:SAM-dependent methyltransferase
MPADAPSSATPSPSSGDAVLSDAERAKQDDAPDARFYDQPRFVQHIDTGFRKRLTDLYRERLSEGACVLDLMSSWVSHLPEEMTFDEVVGHGLNAEELAENPRLDRHFVQDLNADPALPLDDAAFDAVLCAVSVQYLQRPEDVFAEVARVLRPGGVVIVSFSNRMFSQKAIRAWREATGRGRLDLVARVLASTGAFDAPERITHDPFVPPVMRFFGAAPDPFYAVVATRREATR